MPDDPRISQYEAERTEAVAVMRKAILSSYIGKPSPFALGADLDRAVTALIGAGWTPDAPAEKDAETQRLTAELNSWRSGARRRVLPAVEAAPDGLRYASKLLHAQGTEGGVDHDRLLREAAMRMKALHDAAAVCLAERDQARAELRQAQLGAAEWSLHATAARDVLRWLVSLDASEPETRRTVTLADIIRRARAALGEPGEGT